jgi:hypothetical protein
LEARALNVNSDLNDLTKSLLGLQRTQKLFAPSTLIQCLGSALTSTFFSSKMLEILSQHSLLTTSSEEVTISAI